MGCLLCGLLFFYFAQGVGASVFDILDLSKESSDSRGVFSYCGIEGR